MSMYGSQLWNLGLPKMMEPLYIAWRKCVRRIFALPYNTHCNLLSNIAQDTSIDFKLQQRFCKFIQNAYDSNNKCIKVCVNLVGSKSNVSRTWNLICSVYNFDRSYIDGKLTLEKPNTDEHICIKGGLIRDLIGFSMHEKQDNNVKDLIKYLCTE